MDIRVSESSCYVPNAFTASESGATFKWANWAKKEKKKKKNSKEF